jgi:hypothetical protein
MSTFGIGQIPTTVIINANTVELSIEISTGYFLMISCASYCRDYLAEMLSICCRYDPPPNWGKL